MAAIEVIHLTKQFKIYQKQPGMMGSLISLVRRKYQTKDAVRSVSFSIEPGELVGFIGPNGAGKTTTLKCLSGLIYPSGGMVKVLGYTPFDRKAAFLRQIALVMGQKNQLWWDLPPIESFLLNKEIYGVSDSQFKRMVDELAELLDLKDILHVQVRKLSLGQRMKCELAAQLIHMPRVLFLDEPTIGLDVVMQQRLRQFIKAYNERFHTTILLTSHYMEDVKELCKRVIIIDHGSLLYDGSLDTIIKRYSHNKSISVIFSKEVDRHSLEKFGTVKKYTPLTVVLDVLRADANGIVSKLLDAYPVSDLNIEEEKIEDIIRDIFSSHTAHEIP